VKKIYASTEDFITNQQSTFFFDEEQKKCIADLLNTRSSIIRFLGAKERAKNMAIF